mgnify:CR=1 FL=1
MILQEKKGQQGILVMEHMQGVIKAHKLTDVLAIDTKNKELVLRIGVSFDDSSATDHSVTLQ